MTLFAPVRSPHPPAVVLQVHGGAWQRGSRFTDLAQSAMARRLVDTGYAVASVDYRLAPKSPWPDQIVDVKCAVRFLRADAERLGIGPGRIAAWGSSAGGQLVSLLGTAGPGAGWDVGQYAAYPSSVGAVVDEFGPADLTAPAWSPYTTGIIRRVFGRDPGPSRVLAAASPVTYVSPGAPPFLILQGTADRVVFPGQAEELTRRLEADGVPARLVLVDGGPHGLGNPGESPSPDQLAQRVVSFLGAVLGS